MYLLFIRNMMHSHRACFTMRQRTSIRYPPQQHQDHKCCTDTPASFAKTRNAHKNQTTYYPLIYKRLLAIQCI